MIRRDGRPTSGILLRWEMNTDNSSNWGFENSRVRHPEFTILFAIFWFCDLEPRTHLAKSQASKDISLV